MALLLVQLPVHLLITTQMKHLAMVFRQRFQNRLRPVNRIKHVVDNQLSLNAGTASHQKLVLAKDSPVLANRTEVLTGSTVNGVYLKAEAYATSSAALANMYLIVWKNPGGNLTAIPPNTVGLNDDKRFVIHQEMIMFQRVTNSNPRTLFNGVIAIPRGYRRMGPNDELNLSFLAPGVNTDICYQAHYKEFR